MVEKIKSWVENWHSNWNSFVYNYCWSDYVILFDGWIARCAMAVPIVGYLVIFNDAVSQHLSFHTLAGAGEGWLSSSSRLKFVYFGLIFLGTATILYRVRRPFVFKIGTNEFDYVERALEHFTVSAYINIHGTIRDEGHYTLHGKYYDSEYEGFINMALGKRDKSGYRSEDSGNWNLAKAKYESLLRSMLLENFSRNNIKRRYSLTSCIALAIIGYCLLLIPSLDLFLRVLAVSF